jgi:hypothetical protein
MVSDIEALDEEYREMLRIIQQVKKNHVSYIDIHWYDEKGYHRVASLTPMQSEYFLVSHYPLYFEDVDYLMGLVSDHITFDDDYKEELMMKLKLIKGLRK